MGSVLDHAFLSEGERAHPIASGALASGASRWVKRVALARYRGAVTLGRANPTGELFELRHGDQAAVITEVGAHLKSFTVAGRDVVVPFADDELPPAYHGAVLVPWPNRIRDGAYSFDGADYQLDISEPSRHTALHGLTAWQRWRSIDHGPASVTLMVESPARTGYPFQLVTTIRYALGSGGLDVELRTRNIGPTAAPYGVGFHPWLSPGDAPLDEAHLQLDAEQWIATDDRLLPTGATDIPAELDFRSSRQLGSTVIDDAFVGATYDSSGRSWLRLRGADGATAAMWMDKSMSCWQMCTGDDVAPGHRRRGLAAEPMSCVADAFRTGDDLVRLEPDSDHEVHWGIDLV